MGNHWRYAEHETELLVIETHPIQYHAPVYRHLEQTLGISVTAVYGSDFSVAGYHDAEFGSDFAWDTDLLSGYKAVFLSRSSEGGATNDREVNTRGLDAALARLRPRAVLCVGYSPRFHWEALRSAQRTGRPILFRGETTDHARQRGRLKNWVRDVTLQRLYRKCSACMFVGKRSKEHFLRLGVQDERLFFSPYCVDTSPFRTSESARTELREPARKQLGLGPDDLVIAFSGKLSVRKAPDQLIDAVRGLPANVRNRCVMLTIGDGELRDLLDAKARSAPAVKIKQVGFQHQRDLSRFYHASDLLVLPSLHSETWGLVVNEALHHGLPAIVSDAVGCAPDLVEPGKTGEIFATASISELTAALLRCLPTLDRDNTRSLCRAKIQDYSIARAAEGIGAAYQEAISNLRR